MTFLNLTRQFFTHLYDLKKENNCPGYISHLFKSYSLKAALRRKIVHFVYLSHGISDTWFCFESGKYVLEIFFIKFGMQCSAIFFIFFFKIQLFIITLFYCWKRSKITMKWSHVWTFEFVFHYNLAFCFLTSTSFALLLRDKFW